MFRLGDSGLRARDTTDFSPSVAQWTHHQRLTIGGRKALSHVDLGGVPLPPDGWSVAPRLGGLFNRDRSMAVVSPVLPLSRCAEHLFRYTASGYGNVRVWLNVLPGNATAEESVRYPIADFFLSHSQDRRDLASRVRLPPGFGPVTLEIEHTGESRLKVDSAEWSCLSRPSADVATTQGG